MLIKKSALKNIIRESVGFIKESSGAPCPIATANQLHAAGYTNEEVQQFISALTNQFMKNKEQDSPQTGVSHDYVLSPNRGGLIGGVGF